MTTHSQSEPVEDFSKQISIKFFLSLFLFVFLSFKSVALTTSTPIIVSDSSEKAIKKAANKIANRASLYSLILPGMGQAYNKKYWKIPIIYAGLGALGYFIVKSSANVQECHKELLFRYSDISNIDSYQNPKFRNYTASEVNTEKQDAKKYLDFCIIGAGLVYLLNIIDANVDGHFRTFDMSDNLSLSIKPKTFFCIQNPKAVSVGLSLSLNFK